MTFRNQMLTLVAAAVLLAIFSGSRMHAQTAPQAPDLPPIEAPPANGLDQALSHMQKLLEETEYFYKTVTADSGEKYFVVLYEGASGQSQIVIDVREVGTTEGQKIYGYEAYVTVAQAAEGETLPPGVLKLALSESGNAILGHFCTSEDFRYIYASATGTMDGLTRPALRMLLLYVHENRMDMMKAVEAILKEANS